LQSNKRVSAAEAVLLVGQRVKVMKGGAWHNGVVQVRAGPW
jgi:hypothetical protein